MEINKKVVVTGGAGFIGTNLVKRLLSSGFKVVVLDNYAGGKKKERFQSGAEYVEGDIRDEKILSEVFKGANGVFHLAALPRVADSVEKPKETHDVNVNGTLAVLLSAKKAGIKRVVFASSSATYGQLSEDKYPVKEDNIVKSPISPYGLHKLVGEHYCKIFSREFGLETVSLIYFNVYGEYADPDGAYALVIGRFLKQKQEGKPMTICGDGEYYRDYVHVEDVAKANILAMESKMVGGGETINIGSGQVFSVKQIAKIIGGDCVYVPPRPGDVLYTCADISKAKSVLKWEPKIMLADGIESLKKTYL
ncbi:MAG: NAD-dependent epimerase/dehydratase family protein [Candidatus Paceibacterota bacterium]|nr:MAG: NAD-dependent epimerase/dehydratase family protein [Candidatus Paceibacterota bacterium]